MAHISQARGKDHEELKAHIAQHISDTTVQLLDVKALIAQHSDATTAQLQEHAENYL